MADAFTYYSSALAAFPSPLIEAVRPHARLVRAKAGRTIVSPDSRSTDVFVVARGRVQVAVLSAAGHEVILRDLVAGDAFGELAAIDQQARSASIFALEDCVLISIPGALFSKAAYDTPLSAEWLARRLVARIRDLTIRVFELNSLRVPARLHCELLRLCGPGTNTMTRVAIDPSPTHSELASRIGTHREAVTREMGFLVGHGIVQQERRRLTILDVPALARLVHLAAGYTEAEGLASSELQAPTDMT